MTLEKRIILISFYVILWIITTITAGFFFIHEFRSMSVRMSILPLQYSYTPISCKYSKKYDDQVVHIDCPLKNHQTFYPPKKFSYNLDPFIGVFMEMKVEMYQWVINNSYGVINFERKWSSNLEYSHNNIITLLGNYNNPEYIPHIDGVGRQFATEIYGGDFRLSQQHLVNFKKKQKLKLKNDSVYEPSKERPPLHISYINTYVYDDYIYTGSHNNPQIGDLRISFWGSVSNHVSALGVQKWNNTLGVPEIVPIDDTMTKGNNIIRQIVAENDYSAEELFHKYIEDHKAYIFPPNPTQIMFFLTLTLLISFTYCYSKKIQLIFIFPIIFGSAMFSIGLIVLSILPMWVLYNLTIALLIVFVGITFLLIGIKIWSMTKKKICGTKNFHNINETQVSLLNNYHDIAVHKDDSINKITPKSKDIVKMSKHYYEPV